MNNKYQEALRKLKLFLGNSPYIKELTILQELVDKETPMKVDKKSIRKLKCDSFLVISVSYYKCPNKKCELHNNYNILEKEKRCPECNQLLDWSDIDE